MLKGKKLAVIGNKNALTYKEIFHLVRDNKLWLGYTSPSKFYQLSCDEVKNMTGLTRWFTNLDIPKREVIFDTGIDFEYGSKKGWYKKYENYDAINVDKTSQIPMDYDGIMGVPITFIDKYNPNQFEIIGLLASAGHDPVIVGIPKTWEKNESRGVILIDKNGKKQEKVVYARILIRKKK